MDISWIQVGSLGLLILACAWSLFYYMRGMEQRIDKLYELILEEQVASHERFDRLQNEWNSRFYELLKEVSIK